MRAPSSSGRNLPRRTLGTVRLARREHHDRGSDRRDQFLRGRKSRRLPAGPQRGRRDPGYLPALSGDLVPGVATVIGVACSGQRALYVAALPRWGTLFATKTHRLHRLAALRLVPGGPNSDPRDGASGHDRWSRRATRRLMGKDAGHDRVRRSQRIRPIDDGEVERGRKMFATRSHDQRDSRDRAAPALARVVNDWSFARGFGACAFGEA